MEIGELRHRITLQRFATIVSENGFDIETWQDYKTIWASISNLYGREYYQAAAIQVEKTVKFIIRYIEDVDTSTRILFRGKQYHITFIDNIKYANKFIEIKAMGIESSG